jgi:SAM-dependent methyltransferase
MPPESKPLDLSRLREFYEEHGLTARNTGGLIECSEKPVIDVVIDMAEEHTADFRTTVNVGCGANLIADQALAKLGKKVVGMDFAWNFLKLTRPNSGVGLVQGDATQLPFCDEAFDAAICSETLEHILDDITVINEIARVLRPHGWLFLTVPNLWNAARIIEMVKRLDFRVRLMEGHLREYSLKEVSSVLADRFEIEKVYPVGFGWSGRRIGGRIERLVKKGTLRRFSKSVAVAARKR